MRSQVQASPDDIDITSLWSVLRRSGPRLVLASVLVGGLTYAGLMLMPSRYTSDARLKIGVSDPIRDAKSGSGANAEAQAGRLDKEAVRTQVQALQSPDLAVKLAKEMDLASRPEFNPALQQGGIVGLVGRLLGLDSAPPGESEEERVIRAYNKALRVYEIRETRVIAVEFTTQSSDLSAKAANRLVELYQTWLRAQGVVQTADASEWLRPQIDKLTREVAEADAAAEKFRSERNLFRGGGFAGSANTGLNEQQLTDLNTEVSKARAAKSEAEARARAARELLARGSAEAIPDVQKSPTIQALIAQRVRAEREKAEAETSLLAGHPRMKQLNANVTDLKRAIVKEAQFIVEGLEKEAKTLALREELAIKSLDEMKARVGTKSNDIAQLAALEGAAKAKRAELEKLQASYEAARSRGDVKAVPIEAQVISTARPSSTPSSPKRAQLAGLASAATLILGLALVVTRELIGGARGRGQGQQPQAPAPAAPPTLAMPARGERRQPAAGEPIAVAAVAPVVEPVVTRVAAARPTAERTASVAAATPGAVAAAGGFASHDDIGEIARRLLANAQQGGYRTVIVGEGTGDEVREEAADLAGALSGAGKQVALVDWSLDGRGIAEALGLEPTPGFMDLLDGRASFEDVIRRLPDGEAHVVPCGSARADARLDADRLNLVLDALDEAYDHIVVTGEHQAIRDLFLAIEGRFDAGVLVADRRRGAAAANAAPGTFLGFQVTDIDVVRLDRGGAERTRKMQLARSAATAGEARV